MADQSEGKATRARDSKRKAPVQKKEAAASNKKMKGDDDKSSGGNKKQAVNPTSSDFESVDYLKSELSSKGKKFNFKISSWNVDGLRALVKKGGMDYVNHEKPDIICLQETKCSEAKLPDEAKLSGYHGYWASGNSEGYAGVALYSKEKPISVKIGLGIEQHDDEGRVITAEYGKFYLVNTYVPNSGRKLVNLDKRMQWNKDFLEFLEKLDKKKPVILTGDLNVSHEEIDLARPKNNTRNAGFTREERDGFTELLSKGFVDSFRELYPDRKDAYTFWTFMANARAKNVGWRLDYFVISERLRSNLCDSIIRSKVFGSDHCPIVLTLHI